MAKEKPKSKPDKSAENELKGFILILVALWLVWLFFGGGSQKEVEKKTTTTTKTEKTSN
jgi:ammonia channel protein AmtB